VIGKLAALTLGVVVGGMLIILLDIPVVALAIPTGFVAGGALLRGRMQP
jgi:hypothetical protein